MAATRRSTSKREEMCRTVLRELTGVKFEPARPDWLVNPKTGVALELDCYNAELALAVEFNGAQHYRHVKKFHKKAGDLSRQRERDAIKLELCKAAGIDLIVIRGDGDESDEDIRSELRRSVVEILWRREAVLDISAAGEYPDTGRNGIIIISVMFDKQMNGIFNRIDNEGRDSERSPAPRWWIAVGFDPNDMSYFINLSRLGHNEVAVNAGEAVRYIWKLFDKMMLGGMRPSLIKMKLCQPYVSEADESLVWQVIREHEEPISLTQIGMIDGGFAKKWLQNALLSLRKDALEETETL